MLFTWLTCRGAAMGATPVQQTAKEQQADLAWDDWSAPKAPNDFPRSATPSTWPGTFCSASTTS